MFQDQFSIRLLPSTKQSSRELRLGEICVGTLVERFEVHPLAGSVATVAELWRGELRSLIASTAVVGLPTATNLTWILYRVGSEIFVQQKLMLPGAGPQLSTDGKVTRIPRFKQLNEDGIPISQWATTVTSVAEFVAKQDALVDGLASRSYSRSR